MRKTSALSITVLASLLGLGAVAGSQVTGGSISGVVRSQNGDPIASAIVTVVNPDTNQSRETLTDGRGTFRFQALSIGNYELSASADNYAKSTTRRVTLRVNEEARLDFDLAVAGTSEQVNIASPAPPITESSTSMLGIVVDNKQVKELPINGRNFLQLGTLVANVTATSSLTGGAEGGIGNGPFSVSGQRDRSITFLVDGVDTNESLSNSIAAQVALDSIEEFKLITNTGSAEYGYRSGGTLNIVTKSGSNQFHATAFEFFRDDSLNARNHFEEVAGRPVSPFRNNQFGGTASGPILKDRTFWLANYEGQRLRAGNVQFSNVPTEAERHGLFRNPATGQEVQLPVDPVSANILNRYIPLPNTSSEFGNYLATPEIHTRNDFALFRVDHLLSGNDVINARYLISDTSTFNPIVFYVLNNTSGSGVPPTVPGFGLNQRVRAHNLAVGYTRNFSVRSVNDLRVGYNRRFVHVDPEDTLAPGDLGFAGVSTPSGLFEMFVPGITKLGTASYYPIHSNLSNWHISDTFSYLAGRHSLKAGADLRLLRQSIFVGRSGAGIMSFTGIASMISPLADFTMGVPTTALLFPRIVGSPINESGLGFFFQDDFQVSRRLVLNLGLRYELNTVFSSPTNVLTNFSFERGLFTPGVDTTTGLHQGDHNNFAPRVGFAWSVTEDARTVLRGGYGVFYDAPVHADAGSMNGNDPANPRFLFSYAPRGPGMLGGIYAPSAVGASPAVPLFTYDEHIRTPYAQQFNLNLQREFGADLLVSAGYVGTKGTKLITAPDINQAFYIPGVGPDGQPISTPFNVLFRRPTQLNHITPFWADGIGQTESSASSIYHSFEATVTKRLSHGLQILSAYTWSKSIDDAADPIGFAGDSNGPQNSRDRHGDRSLSVFDTRQRFTAAYNYQLPLHGGRLRDGWSVHGLMTRQSGQPFTAVLGFDTSLTGSRSLRPNAVPGGLINKDGQVTINPSLPRDPATGIPVAFIPATGQFGTLGRNTLTGPAYTNFDMSLMKDTHLREGLKIQGRFEVFNVFNTTNLALPERRLNEPFFGRSTKTQDVAGGVPGIGGGGPRVMQLAVKLIF